jgi:hypothetical protein
MKSIIVLAALAAATTARADDKKSKVDVTTAAKGDNLEMTFKVVPVNGLHINLEGPWKLEIKEHDGLAFSSDKFARKDLDEKLTGYVVTTSAKPAKPSGEVDYALTAFVCTDDKTACYREVHTGKAPWSVAAK